jgi:hypothetical protein
LPIATTSWPTRSRREGWRLAVQAQDGEVGVGIVADRIRREAAPVGKGRLDLAGAADDVAVGQHIGVRGEDDAGPGSARAVLDAADLQVQDGRTDAVDRADDRARIGVEQHQILGRGRGDRRRGAVGLQVADRIVNGSKISHMRVRPLEPARRNRYASKRDRHPRTGAVKE